MSVHPRESTRDRIRALPLQQGAEMWNALHQRNADYETAHHTAENLRLDAADRMLTRCPACPPADAEVFYLDRRGVALLQHHNRTAHREDG